MRVLTRKSGSFLTLHVAFRETSKFIVEPLKCGTNVIGEQTNDRVCGAFGCNMENNFRCMQQKTKKNQKLHKHFSCTIEMQLLLHALMLMQRVKWVSLLVIGQCGNLRRMHKNLRLGLQLVACTFF